MDEFDVHPENVSSVFQSATAVSRLRELASESLHSQKPLDPSKDAIVAGRTLDLHGPYNCSRFACTKHRIDRTFLSTWHYFDSIVVTGPNESNLIRAISTTKRKDREDRLIEPITEDIRLFSYLRQIGAEKHLDFRRKSYPLCDCCYPKAAERIGLTAVTDEAAKGRVMSSLEASAHVQSYLRSPGVWACEIDHDALPERFVWHIRSKRKPSKKEMLEDFLHQATRGLLEDYYHSKELSLPLIQEVRTSFYGKVESSKNITDYAIALSVELPFLKGATAADIIKLMEDERPSFERFQVALRKAIQEKAEKAGDASPEELGKRVTKDYIRPSLAEIDILLSSAKKAFAKKSATAVGIGSVLVTAGILTAMPLVIAAGATAAASPLIDAKKYLDDRSALESKDMYFLWQVGKSRSGIH